jgi:hypothetical protein
MRPTPARMLHQDQLLVDRYAVHKINKVEYPLPQNIVAVQLSNQMTGEQSTRNLRWDEQVTTDEPFEVEIGDTGKITIELAQLADEAGSPASGTTSSDCSAILPEKRPGALGRQRRLRRKLPRWMAWRSMMPNQTSTRFSHDPEVGVKWMWILGFAASQAFTFGCLWAP